MKIWVIISRMRVVSWMSRVAAAIWRFVVLHYSKRRLDKDDKHNFRKTKALCAPSSPDTPLNPVGVTSTLVKFGGVCSLIPRITASVGTAADVQAMALADYEAAAGMQLMHSWGKDTPVKYNAEMLDKENAVLAHKLNGRSLLAKEEDTASEAPTASTDSSSVADSEEMEEVGDEVDPRSECEIDGEGEGRHNQDGEDEANSPSDSDGGGGGGDSTEVEYIGFQHQFGRRDTGNELDSDEGDTEEGHDESKREVDSEAGADVAKPDEELESSESTVTGDGDDETSNNVRFNRTTQFKCFEKEQEPDESSDEVERVSVAIGSEDTVLEEPMHRRGTDVAKYICHFEVCKTDEIVSSQNNTQLVHRATRWECVGYGRYVKCSPEKRTEPKTLTMTDRSVHWMRVGHCRYDKYVVDEDGTMTLARGTRTSEEGALSD